MRLLVLGGTVFLGRHLVEAALAGGHDVTLFNRGQSNPGLFSRLEHVRGERDGGLEALKGRRWDAVVDTSGFVPRVVRQSAYLLAGGTGFYAFVSSGSVYPLDSADRSETGPLVELDDPTSEDVSQHYGGLKALCEQEVVDVYGAAALIVRSGLIAGPHDPTGRFTYWTVRVPRGGEVLAPGNPGRQVQFIDARDQAAWILAMASAGRGGIYNVTGLMPPVTLGQVIALCGGAPVTWVSEEFLLEAKVRPYVEMPLWVPSSAGTLNMPIERAVAAGLRFRPLADTIRDTREWALANPNPGARDAGGRVRRPSTLTPEREAELLRAWHGPGG